MKVKVKFTGTNLRGRKSVKTLELVVPDFKEKTYNPEVTTGNPSWTVVLTFTSSVLDQVDKFIEEEVDKAELLVRFDWLSISDWKIEPKKVKTESKSVEQLLRELFPEDSETLKAVLFVAQDLGDSISSLKPEKQIEILLASVNSSARPATEAYRKISESFKAYNRRLDEPRTYADEQARKQVLKK